MIINISDILQSANKERTEEVTIGLESFSSKLGDFPITQKAPIMLHIENVENRQLRLEGSGEIEVLIPCDRCLTEVPTKIHFDIDRALSITEDTATDEEMEITDYLIGFELDVDKLVYAEILVNWPMRVLCKDDCQGICKVCGTNLNSGSCDCQRTELDPRMAAIQDIFHKFQN